MEVSLPSTDSGLATYYIIAPAEASANLARYDGVKYGLSTGEDDLLDNYLRTRGSGFGLEVKRRIMLGTYALSAGYYDAFYVKAQQVRTLIKAEFDAVLADVDALIAPTSPSVAFKIGAKTQDPLLMYLNDACTLPVNIAGLPGISVPCGLSDGLPVGLQVIGRAFDEAMVLRVADAFERAAGFDHASAADGARLMTEISHVRLMVPDQATLNRILREGGAQSFPQWLYAEPGEETRLLWWGVREARSMGVAPADDDPRSSPLPATDRRLDRSTPRALPGDGRRRPSTGRPGRRWSGRTGMQPAMMPCWAPLAGASGWAAESSCWPSPMGMATRPTAWPASARGRSRWRLMGPRLAGAR